MKETLKKVWNITSTTLVVLIVLCAVFLMGSRLLGYQAYTVLSGSMEPAYGAGDLLYVKRVDVNEIRVGDPITFVMNENLVVATHRVVRVDADKKQFYTKGDANEIEDQDPVHFNNVIGVPRFAIPKLGYVSDYVQNPPGRYVTIGVATLLIFLVFLPDFLPKKEQPEEVLVSKDTPLSDENARLKAELEAVKAQLQTSERMPPATDTSDEKF